MQIYHALIYHLLACYFSYDLFEKLYLKMVVSYLKSCGLEYQLEELLAGRADIIYKKELYYLVKD